jgi:hypothetical protein
LYEALGAKSTLSLKGPNYVLGVKAWDILQMVYSNSSVALTLRNCTGDIMENLYSKVPPDSPPQFNGRKNMEGEGTRVRLQNSFVGRLLPSARVSVVM